MSRRCGACRIADGSSRLHDTRRKLGLKQRLENRGGVNNDQRLSRSARMICVGSALPS
jgi:hypothetical protein